MRGLYPRLHAHEPDSFPLSLWVSRWGRNGSSAKSRSVSVSARSAGVFLIARLDAWMGEFRD